MHLPFSSIIYINPMTCLDDEQMGLCIAMHSHMRTHERQEQKQVARRGSIYIMKFGILFGVFTRRTWVGSTAINQDRKGLYWIDDAPKGRIM